MSAIQQHPWFRNGLPEGASMMNTMILRSTDVPPGMQTEDEIRALVRVRRGRQWRCTAWLFVIARWGLAGASRV